MPTGTMASAARRGLFIVFEGLDRSGKTSQSTRLADEMVKLGGKTKKMNFPDRQNCTGTIVNEYLKSSRDLSDECIHLLFSANRWEAREGIIKDLNDGMSIVCDRYCYSGVSYSTAKGLSAKWCTAPDVGLPEPDVVVYLRINSEIAEQRGGYGEERYEKKAFQEKVGAQFENFCSSDKNWLIVDGAKTPDEVAKDIRDGLAKRGLWLNTHHHGHPPSARAPFHAALNPRVVVRCTAPEPPRKQQQQQQQPCRRATDGVARF